MNLKRKLLIAIFLTIQPVLGAMLVVNQTTPCTTGDAYFNSIQNAIDNVGRCSFIHFSVF